MPKLRVEVQGHADPSEGKRAERLALERARAVRDELVKRGVAKDRMTIKSFGAQRPLAPSNAQGAELNARVQFEILEGADP
jgi:OOP family OmpA-OmpF porin